MFFRGENPEIGIEKSNIGQRIDSEILEKYDRIMGDDILDSGDISGNGIELSDEELNEKYDSLMNSETVDSQVENKRYYDDNGQLYRVGNKLEPQCQYDINHYHYQTDELGRIVSAEGKLHLKNREGRLPIRDSIEDIGKGDQRENDDRGHLIGDQFDGTNGLENMIPQDSDINRHDFKNFENELAKEVKEGHQVSVEIEPFYENGSRRPTDLVVTYCIDGNEDFRIFPNEKRKEEL